MEQIQEYLKTHEVTKCPTVCLIKTRGLRLSPADTAALNQHQRNQDIIRELKEQLYKQGPYFYAMNKNKLKIS